MNWKLLGLGLVFADFAALNVYVLYHYGLIGFFEQALANAATITVLVDLTIALSLVTIWMWRDARDRGWTVMPYLLVTAVLGSIGPLAYLIRREAATAPAQVGALRPAR